MNEPDTPPKTPKRVQFKSAAYNKIVIIPSRNGDMIGPYGAVDMATIIITIALVGMLSLSVSMKPNDSSNQNEKTETETDKKKWTRNKTWILVVMLLSCGLIGCIIRIVWLIKNTPSYVYSKY